MTSKKGDKSDKSQKYRDSLGHRRLKDIQLVDVVDLVPSSGG